MATYCFAWTWYGLYRENGWGGVCFVPSPLFHVSLHRFMHRNSAPNLFVKIRGCGLWWGYPVLGYPLFHMATYCFAWTWYGPLPREWMKVCFVPPSSSTCPEMACVKVNENRLQTIYCLRWDNTFLEVRQCIVSWHRSYSLAQIGHPQSSKTSVQK